MKHWFYVRFFCVFAIDFLLLRLIKYMLKNDETITLYVIGAIVFGFCLFTNAFFGKPYYDDRQHQNFAREPNAYLGF